MVAHVERQLLAQPIDQRRAVLVEELDEADVAFLRVAAGERLRLGVLELAPQRFVPALGRLDDLAVQLLESSCMRAERRSRRAFERRIDLRHCAGDRGPSARRSAAPRRVERRSTAGGSCAFEQLVERGFVLRAQRLERHARTSSGSAAPPNPRASRWRAGYISGIGTPKCVVDAAQLAEIRQLVRPGDVADRREERVLHERPQQHVRAEVAGCSSRLFDQRRGARSLVADVNRPSCGESARGRRSGGRAPRCRPCGVPARGSRAPAVRAGAAPPAARSRRASTSSRANTSAPAAWRPGPTSRRRPGRAGRAPPDPPAERVGHAGARRVGARSVVEERRA